MGSTGDLGTTEAAVGKAIAEQWYQKEVGFYNFFGQSDPPPGADFSKFGHFSQLVWKDSTKAGCATVKCPAGTVLSYPSYFTVCNYSPPGKTTYFCTVMIIFLTLFQATLAASTLPTFCPRSASRSTFLFNKLHKWLNKSPFWVSSAGLALTNDA